MEYNANVAAGRTEEFNKATEAVSNFIDSLNLPAETQNKLVELLLINVIEAEVGAFRLGVSVAGHTAALAARENREPIEEDFKEALKEYGALEEIEK